MNTSSISIQSTISAPLNKVWQCYTEPKHITHWNFADDSWHCPSASNDLQVGGKYSARMEAKDGSFGFDFETIYDEVELNKKLAYTMTDGRKAMVNFDEEKDKVNLIIQFDAENENPVDMQRDGWQAILNNFKKYVESL